MAAPSDTNFGSKGALSKASSAAFRFEVPKRACGRRCRNFKSAALGSRRLDPADECLQLLRRVTQLAGELANDLDRFSRPLDLQQLVDEILARLQRSHELGKFHAGLVEIIGRARISSTSC